jgi:hypothetical protein
VVEGIQMTSRVGKIPLLEPIRTKGGALFIPIERTSDLTIFIHTGKSTDTFKHTKNNDSIIDYDKRTWKYVARLEASHDIMMLLFNPDSWKPFR